MWAICIVQIPCLQLLRPIMSVTSGHANQTIAGMRIVLYIPSGYGNETIHQLGHFICGEYWGDDCIYVCITYFLCPKCRSLHKTIMVITVRAHCYPLDICVHMYSSNTIFAVTQTHHVCSFWLCKSSNNHMSK